jgi:glycosyltransferase involved in cell wall biosynthesis
VRHKVIAPSFIETTYDYPPDPLYGMGVYVGAMADGLSAAGSPVLVTTRNNAGRAEDETTDSGVRVVRCSADWDREHLQCGSPNRTAGQMAGIVALSRELYSRTDRVDFPADVVHNHSFATVPLACELSELRGLPLISTVHVVDEMMDEAQGSSRPRTTDRHVNRALEAEGLRHSQIIIAPSETVRRALAKEYPDLSGRVQVIPLPLSGNVRRKTTYTAHDPFRILFVGRMISYKGVRELLAAASGIPRLEIWMAGGGPAEGELEAQAAADGVSVRWLGQLPRTRVLELYAEVDALAVLSLVETYGLVLQEGQRAGAPIICTDIAAFDDRVRDGFDCLTVPAILGPDVGRVDVDALRTAMRSLMTNERLRERLGRNAFHRAELQPGLTEHATQLQQLVTML